MFRLVESHMFYFIFIFGSIFVQSPRRSASPRVPRATSMDERTFTSTAQSKYDISNFVSEKRLISQMQLDAMSR